MSLSFELIRQDRARDLAEWLSSESWPYHGQTQVTPERVLNGVAQGFYWSDQTRSVWVHSPAARDPIGFIRLFDLGDLTAMFDLRFKANWRGQGFGKQALLWLTDYVFANFPEVHRMAGTTRSDNRPMRRTFERAGYVQEALYRKAWDAPGLKPQDYFDAIGYSVLRSEWPPASSAENLA